MCILPLAGIVPPMLYCTTSSEFFFGFSFITRKTLKRHRYLKDWLLDKTSRITMIMARKRKPTRRWRPNFASFARYHSFKSHTLTQNSTLLSVYYRIKERYTASGERRHDGDEHITMGCAPPRAP